MTHYFGVRTCELDLEKEYTNKWHLLGMNDACGRCNVCNVSHVCMCYI